MRRRGATTRSPIPSPMYQTRQTEQEERGERDAGGGPDHRDLLGDEGEHEPDLRRGEVDQGGAEDAGPRAKDAVGARAVAADRWVWGVHRAAPCEFSTTPAPSETNADHPGPAYPISGGVPAIPCAILSATAMMVRVGL